MERVCRHGYRTAHAAASQLAAMVEPVPQMEGHMSESSRKRSWLYLVASISALAMALLVNPQPAFAEETCVDSAGNGCCFNCQTGAKVACGDGVCIFPNHAWPMT